MTTIEPELQSRAPREGERRLVERLWARGFRFLFVLDAVALLVIMITTNLVRFGTSWPTYPLTHYSLGFAVVLVIHLVVGYFSGLYVREPRLARRAWLPRIVGASLVAVLVDALAFLVTSRSLMPRGNLVVLFFAGSVALAANRRLSRYLARRRQGPPRVALVGAPDDITAAVAHLHESDREARVVARTAEVDDLLELVVDTGATDVLLLSGRTLDDVFPEPLTSLEGAGIGVLQRVGAKETLLGLQSVRELAGMPFVLLRAHTVPGHKAKLKRLLELALLVVLTPVLVPALAFTAAYTALAAGRPLLYTQDRVGRDGKVFGMLKFRTMTPDAEEGLGPRLARRGDPRVIRPCQWLRDTRLDELPQIWNVLKGEMSVVGPRPERPEFTERFEELIPGYARRHELPPGITGLAQISGRYHTDPGFKLGHDLQYLVNWSPILDLQILFRTVWVVVSRRV